MNNFTETARSNFQYDGTMDSSRKENLLDKDCFFKDSLRFQKNQSRPFANEYSKGNTLESYGYKYSKIQQQKSVNFQPVN